MFFARKTEENKKLNADIAKMKAELVTAFGGRTGS
jgi:hypothetical protein